MKKISAVIVLLLLNACASKPTFTLDNIDYKLNPSNVSLSSQSIGHTVLWGGIILSSNNLKNQTRLEILSYPIDKQGRLDTEAEPLGRFHAIYSGYLETAEYRKNRWVSLTGIFTGMENGTVGDAQYSFPQVKITQLHLWNQQNLQGNSPNIQFGIGVLFH